MSPYRHLPRAQRLAHEHPFALALIVLLLVVIPGFVRVQQVTDDLHRTQINACQAGNEARRNQIDLWTYVIQISAKPNQTQAQKDTVARFEVRLHQIFAPRDCG